MATRYAHGSFLTHLNFLWFKRAVWLVIAALVAYLSHTPLGGHNGGTIVGYGLGGIGAALILWLSWLGVRKRSFAGKRSRRDREKRAPSPSVGTPQELKGWTSAHVYLGLALIFVGTLHTGFEFGWNVHTLAYALMMFVIVSGAWGVFAYLRYPNLMSENRAGESADKMRKEMADIDARLERLTQRLPDQYAKAVRHSLTRTRIGGGLFSLLSGSSRGCATARALRESTKAANDAPGANSAAVSELIGALSKKAELAARLRRDLMFKALMDVWLWIHVPVTIALICSLIAHVIIVFFYW